MSILKDLTNRFNKLRLQGKALPESITLNYTEYLQLVDQCNYKYGYEEPIESVDTYMGVKIIVTIGENTHGTNNL